MEKEESGIVIRVVFYSIFGVVVVAMCALLWGEVRPALLDQEREAVVHSRQYVESRQSEIRTQVDECLRINTQIASLTDQGGHEATVAGLRSQRTALATRVRTAVSRLPEGTDHIDTSACN